MTNNIDTSENPKDLPPERPGAHTSRLGMIAFLATFGGLLFGYDTGVINGAVNPMKVDLSLTPMSQGFVVSILVFGAAFGAAIAGRISDWNGRRYTILILSMVFIVGTIGSALSPSWQMLALFRFILGLAVGGASTTVPVYLAEVSPTERRGSLVTRNEIMIVSGQFAAFIINAIILNIWGDYPGIWRYMLVIAVLPAFALLIGMLRVPESPRWLSGQDRPRDALAVLKLIRSPERAEAELAEVDSLVEEEQASKVGGWSDLAVPWIRKLIIIGAVLGIFQQLTGINAIMYYGTQLLESSGFSDSGAVIANTLNGLFSVLGITVGVMLINKLNRRIMLIGGFCLVALFHVLVGLTAMFLPDVAAKPYVILFFMVAFVFSMQGTLGPLVWLILSEIFPLKIRSFSMGLCVLVLWLANAGVAFGFPPVVTALGIGSTFFIFAVIAVLGVIFTVTMVPETRGKSLEECEDQFRTQNAGSGIGQVGVSNAAPADRNE
ncbi:sugar porter family MFS transporter [Salinisphaera sp. USBA-960]|uniref:sugar porter family MFS transporter n=1 Tax=Salinisphaera orenii TaxID=856731 RepID=UPI000DBE160F|nr:sugar porter family MFS transporter [Salifodinibacter halophilus]NNC25673.1 sugar porter family MFS transporter [Salifodinibacter halophilus]